MIKKYKRLVLSAGIVLLAVGTWSFNDDLFEISKNLEVFTALYKEINLNYVDDLNPSKFIKTGADAMLENLDPYTEFIPESEIEDYKLHYVSTQYGGIGASVFVREGKIYVSGVFEGYPAQKADIRAGDQLLKINDVSLEGKNNDQVSELLKGSKGASIKLLVKRENDAQPAEKNIT